MEENNYYDFMLVCKDFVDSSKKLNEAAALCDDDPVKQEMVAFIIPDFQKMFARSEGIKVLLEQERYDKNRGFILEEMKAVTKENLKMARRITDKLSGLI